MQRNSHENLFLMAGPAQVSPAVQKILSHPIIYHRGDEFVEIFERVTENLKYLFQTEQEVIILTASGTGGMEATISNLFSPGETVLFVENGKFSERWSQIAEFFGLNVTRIKIPWGKSPDVNQLIKTIKDTQNLKAIFLTHCETSTGALTDLETIIPQLRGATASIIIVDAIASAGVLPLKMDQWGIDVIVTGSQKGLGLPPGLAIVSLNKKLWQYIEQAELPRYYFDFARARQALRLGRGSAYTPAIPLVLAADVVLTEIRQIGLEHIWQDRGQLAHYFRQRILATGLDLLPEFPADCLTAVKIDKPFQANHIISLLLENYGIVVSRGQGKLANKVIRVGHFANVDKKQLDRFLHAMKEILFQLA